MDCIAVRSASGNLHCVFLVMRLSAAVYAIQMGGAGVSLRVPMVADARNFCQKAMFVLF